MNKQLLQGSSDIENVQCTRKEIVVKEKSIADYYVFMPPMWCRCGKILGSLFLSKNPSLKNLRNELRYGIPNPCYKTLYPCYETPNPCYETL